MPSCLSTGVKLGRRLRVGVRVAESSQRRPETQSRRWRRSRTRAAVAEDRGCEHGQRNRGREVSGTQGRGAVLVAGGGGCVGPAVKTYGTRGGGKGGRTTPPEEKTAQRQRRRTTNSRRGGSRLGWRGLCGGGDCSSVAESKWSGLQREVSRRMACWFLPFLGSDRSATDQVCRLLSVADLSQISERR
ncbi:hypothetical protein Syun_029887 [Stephania yunnanensis]|uniref:Uncharacterized protein n=1 Tax=Stephania yunnanensis TaxID=152371 RepID=A0AAP0HGF8_9MAGN